MVVGEYDFPDLVLDVNYSTDVHRGKLGLYESWGFPVLRRSPLCMPATATAKRPPAPSEFSARPLGTRILPFPRDGGYSRMWGESALLSPLSSPFLRSLLVAYGLDSRRIPQEPSPLDALAAYLPPRPGPLLPTGLTIARSEPHPLRERATPRRVGVSGLSPRPPTVRHTALQRVCTESTIGAHG